jgi:hypothetical protein
LPFVLCGLLALGLLGRLELLLGLPGRTPFAVPSIVPAHKRLGMPASIVADRTMVAKSAEYDAYGMHAVTSLRFEPNGLFPA